MGKFTLYWAVDDRGDFPGTQGLSASINLDGLPIQRDRVKLGYEWASMYPKEGLHVAQDPKWMQSYVNNIGTWLDMWCGKDFDGYFALDFESLSLYWEDNSDAVKTAWHDWNMQNNPYFRRLKPSGYEKFYRDSWNVAMKKFYSATIAECHKQRPAAKFCIWGVPYISAWDIYNPTKVYSWDCRWYRLKWLWEISDFFMPSPYTPRIVVDNPVNWWEGTYNFVKDYQYAVLRQASRTQIFGGSKDKEIISCINLRNVPAVMKDSGQEWVDSNSLNLMIQIPKTLGYNVAIWDALESKEKRDEMQNFIDTNLKTLTF